MRRAVGNKPAGPSRRHVPAIIGVAAATLFLLAGLAYYALTSHGVKSMAERPPIQMGSAEVETQRKAIERLRLEAAKAEEEQAKRAAEAETKRKNDEESQRAAQVEQERQAAVAEAEAKRKAAAAEAEQQRLAGAKAEQAKAPSDAEATKTEQDRKARAAAERGAKPGEGRASAGAASGGSSGASGGRPAWMDNRSGGGSGGTASGGGGEQQKQSPQFPWPPPAVSAFYVLPDSWFAGLHTLGEVISAIIPALERNGYVERSFFGVEGNGVALVTRLERISGDGSSFAEPQRWSGAGYSLSGFLKGLFFVEPGRYRIIVFIFRNRPFSQSAQIVTKDEARAWLSSGADTLSPEAGQSSFGGWHCTVLIYEFASDGRAVRVVESSLTGKQHLTKAGLLSLLEKN